ncbi:MAG: hypothetical protein JRJ59_12045, partial [Deltaproteobacteria bacterium]|nr:hypothetical protein [Deltaproteobacteria bacterium]
QACSRLREQIETATVAKKGLESILSTYFFRYGDGVQAIEDVGRFKAILAEKERELAGLEEDLAVRGREIEDFIKDLDQRQAAAQDSLESLARVAAEIREARQTGLARLTRDKAKVQAVVDQFWPPQDQAPLAEPRINLPAETLQAAVDQVLNRMEPDQAAREELLSQIVSSIRDEDLRQALSQKLSLNDQGRD